MTVRYITKSSGSAAQDTAAPYANVTGGAGAAPYARQDLIINCMMNKPYSTTPSIADTDWSLIGTHTNGTVANGIDAGSCRVTAWSYEPTDIVSSITGPSIAFDGQYTPVYQNSVQFAATDGDTWDISSTTAADTDESSTAVSATGAAVLGFTVGDRVVVVAGFNSDTAAITGAAISATGATFGTLTQRVTTPGTAVGNDGSLYIYDAEVTAGTATGALTFTGTAASAAQSGCAVLIIRLHRTGTSIDLYTRDFTDTTTAGVDFSTSFAVYLHGAGDTTPDAESYYSDLSLTGTSTTIATRSLSLYHTPDDECVYEILFKSDVELGYNCDLFDMYDEAGSLVLNLNIDSNGGQIAVQNSAGTTLGYTRTILSTTQWSRVAVKHVISTKTITLRLYTGENLDSDTPTEEVSYTYATSPGYPRRFRTGFLSNRANTVIYWNRLRVTKTWPSAPGVVPYDAAYVKYYNDSLDATQRTGLNPDVVTTTSPLAMTMPASITAGMFAIAYILHAHSTASSVTTPSGWTLEGSQFVEIGAIDYTLYMYSKELDGTETTVDFVFSPTANGLFGWIEVYDNVDVVNGPWDVTPTLATSAAAATYAPTSITTTNANALAIAFAATVDDNLLKLATDTDATGFAVRVNMNAIAGNDSAMMSAVKSIPAAGSVTMPTFTESQNGNDAWLSITAALRSETGATEYTRTIDDNAGISDAIVGEEQEQESGTITDEIGITEDATEIRIVSDSWEDTLGLTDELTVETTVANVFTGWGIPTSHP